MASDEDSSLKHKALFDPTINYGHILTAVTFTVAGAGAYYGMRAELESVDQRVAKIENTLQLASVLIVTARQDERLVAIERRVDRLEEAPARK